MEPFRKLVICASKWIGQSKRRHEILGQKKRVCHRRNGTSLSPMKRESTNCVKKCIFSAQARSQSYQLKRATRQSPRSARPTIPELVLAKISRLRYIAFGLLIRYVDIRVFLIMKRFRRILAFLCLASATSTLAGPSTFEAQPSP